MDMKGLGRGVLLAAAFTLASATQGVYAADEGMQLNINEASAAELTQLVGIGDTYAERIVEYREENGGFSTVEDITEVRGIGPATLDNIRDDIVTE